jgi:hypothetical protein
MDFYDNFIFFKEELYHIYINNINGNGDLFHSNNSI